MMSTIPGQEKERGQANDTESKIKCCVLWTAASCTAHAGKKRGISSLRSKFLGEEYIRREVRKEPCFSKERRRAYVYYCSF